MRMAFGLPVSIAPLVDELLLADSLKSRAKSSRPPANAPVDSGSFPFLGVPPTESKPSIDAAFTA